jgi:hypothetical protein
VSAVRGVRVSVPGMPKHNKNHGVAALLPYTRPCPARSPGTLVSLAPGIAGSRWRRLGKYVGGGAPAKHLAEPDTPMAAIAAGVKYRCRLGPPLGLTRFGRQVHYDAKRSLAAFSNSAGLR